MVIEKESASHHHHNRRFIKPCGCIALVVSLIVTRSAQRVYRSVFIILPGAEVEEKEEQEAAAAAAQMASVPAPAQIAEYAAPDEWVEPTYQVSLSNISNS